MEHNTWPNTSKNNEGEENSDIPHPNPNLEQVLPTFTLTEAELIKPGAKVLNTPWSLNNRRARLFISFQVQEEASEKLVEEVIRQLGERHEVFVDRTARVGLNWAIQIEAELGRADYLIIFLSPSTVQSEMVEAEIATAYKLGKENYGRPRILLVRLAFRDKLQYPLSAYLEGLSEASWQGPKDTSGLVNALKRAIAGQALIFPYPGSEPEKSTGSIANLLTTGSTLPLPVSSPFQDYPAPLPSAQPPRLEMPEGTMDPQSFFYVERVTDLVALETIRRQGVTITIKGPRQMGKSSLLLRVREAALATGKRVALLDFQLFDKAALSEPDLFFRQFCEWVSDELEMESRVEEFWRVPLGNSQRTTRYLQRYLLKELGNPLVLAMDEVESTFDTSFRSDFFGMLRSWHNSRQTNSLWKQLDLVLVTSTEPYQLIENLNQSPFNVGEVIELEDFTASEVKELNRRHGSPFSGVEEDQLVTLLNGHPYLVRRALYLVGSGRLTPGELFSTATRDRGPFGDHLRHHLFRLNNKPKLIEGLRQVIRYQTCSDEAVFFRLRGAGLVKREDRLVVPRCQLYASYLQEKFLEKLPTGPLPPLSTMELEPSTKEQANFPAGLAATGPVQTSLPASLAGISERETEVLRLVAAGLSNLAVAEKLFLSPHTINRHLTSIYNKIGVSSRTEAARFAHEHGLL